MRLIQTLSVIVFSMSLACSSSPEPKVDTSIYRIAFAQGGCYGECPAEAFSIDTSLTIRYRGVEFVDSIGSFIGKVSLETWNAIVARCRNINYHNFDTLYNMCIDAQMHEIYIYDTTGSKHIMFQDCPMHARDSLHFFTEWLREVIVKSDLNPVNDSLVFETQYQDPPQMAKVDTPFYFTEPEVE